MLDSKLKRTMMCMMVGSGIYNVILIIVSSILFFIYYRNLKIFVLKNEVCVIIGFICSIVGINSMTMSLAKAISANDVDYAKRHMIIASIIRLIAFCLLLIIIIKIFGFIGGMMFALAILGIKVGAYLTPIIEKRI